MSFEGSRGLPHRGQASCMLNEKSFSFKKNSQITPDCKDCTYVVEFLFNALTKGSLQLLIR